MRSMDVASLIVTRSPLARETLSTHLSGRNILPLGRRDRASDLVGSTIDGVAFLIVSHDVV